MRANIDSVHRISAISMVRSVNHASCPNFGISTRICATNVTRIYISKNIQDNACTNPLSKYLEQALNHSTRFTLMVTSNKLNNNLMAQKSLNVQVRNLSLISQQMSASVVMVILTFSTI